MGCLYKKYYDSRREYYDWEEKIRVIHSLYGNVRARVIFNIHFWILLTGFSENNDKNFGYHVSRVKNTIYVNIT